jgi:hypothetical protein
MRIDHDGIFKQLLEECFVEFRDLFVPDALHLLDPPSVTFLDKQVFRDLIDPDRREADLVVQAQFLGELTTLIVHIEHQAQEDKVLHEHNLSRVGVCPNLHIYDLSDHAFHSELERHGRLGIAVESDRASNYFSFLKGQGR